METKLRPYLVSLAALTLCTLSLFGQRQRPRQYDYPATLDTEGKHVNAHGGSIFRHGDQWLWYGEARPERGFTSVGVALYTAPATADMSQPQTVAWQNRGLVMSVVDEAGSPIERGCIIERPKVLWNESDKQFVMLFHLELKGRGYDAAMTGFATSKTAEGSSSCIMHRGPTPVSGQQISPRLISHMRKHSR